MTDRAGQDDWSAVEPYLNDALDLPRSDHEPYLSRLESEHPDIAAALRELLATRDVLEASGFPEGGAALPVDQERVGAELDRVTALASDNGLSDSLTTQRAQLVRIEWLLAQGRTDDARRMLDPVLLAARDSKTGNGLMLPGALLWSAKIALAQGRYQDAVNAADAAVKADEQRALDPANSADVGEASLWLAKARGAQHDETGMLAAAHTAAISLTASLGADNPLTSEALTLASGRSHQGERRDGGH